MLKNGKRVPMDPDQLLLKGSCLRNTEWCLGLAVFVTAAMPCWARWWNSWRWTCRKPWLSCPGSQPARPRRWPPSGSLAPRLGPSRRKDEPPCFTRRRGGCMPISLSTDVWLSPSLDRGFAAILSWLLCWRWCARDASTRAAWRAACEGGHTCARGSVRARHG